VALPESDLPPGTIVAGYEIVRLIGHGGMGNVYLANQLSMRRMVALKLLLKALTEDKEAVGQFINEARVSGRLSHKNIITAIDAGEYDGSYYLATTYVDGDDLEKRLDGGMALPEKVSLGIVLKIGAALSYAWDNHGMLHKDIKPGNIIVDSRGEPYLMDMGIAQFIGDAHKSDDEHIFGSPFYMSPEQATGSRLDWSSDMYSLGATLYHMILGVPPYDAPEVMDIIEMHVSAPFPDPQLRNPSASISPPTVDILRRMMAKKPSERYDSWSGLHEAVEAVLLGDKPKPPRKSAAKKKASKKKGLRKKKRRTRRVSADDSETPDGVAPMAMQKKEASMAPVWIALILVLVAGIGSYVYYDQSKEAKASKVLNAAKSYYATHPGDFEPSVSRLRRALATAKGTSLEASAAASLRDVQAAYNREKSLIAAYKAAKPKARKLVNDGKFDEAAQLVVNLAKGIRNADIARNVKLTLAGIEYERKKASEKGK
jgi:serine/threonine protein kinase